MNTSINFLNNFHSTVYHTFWSKLLLHNSQLHTTHTHTARHIPPYIQWAHRRSRRRRLYVVHVRIHAAMLYYTIVYSHEQHISRIATLQPRASSVETILKLCMQYYICTYIYIYIYISIPMPWMPTRNPAEHRSKARHIKYVRNTWRARVCVLVCVAGTGTSNASEPGRASSVRSERSTISAETRARARTDSLHQPSTSHPSVPLPLSTHSRSPFHTPNAIRGAHPSSLAHSHTHRRPSTHIHHPGCMLFQISKKGTTSMKSNSRHTKHTIRAVFTSWRDRTAKQRNFESDFSLKCVRM